MNDSKKATILIVEDDAGISVLQQKRLERFGHDVVLAVNAEEALRFVSEKWFDLIVLDYALEGEINGVDLFLILRERGYRVPAILVTGFEDPQILMRAMRAGMRDFLPKSTEFLNDLPLAVERVMKQVVLEQQAAESAIVREKQELLETAFDAASLACCLWDSRLLELKWLGHAHELFGYGVEEHCRSLDAFLNFIDQDDRAKVMDAINQGRELRAPIEIEFRFHRASGDIRWLSANGRYYWTENSDASRMILVFSDITSRKESEVELVRSNSQIKALNDRLQLSMVEINHRAKNSLQNIVSLLNLHIRKQGTLSEEEVKKVTSVIEGLATVHDVMLHQIKEDCDSSAVAVDEVLKRVLSLLDRASGARQLNRSLQHCSVTSRQAASLTVIVNELVSNALKHSSGTITVTLENSGNAATLTVKNEGSKFPVDFNPVESQRTGVKMIMALATGDLGEKPEFFNTDDGCAAVRIRFPVLSGDRSLESRKN